MSQRSVEIVVGRLVTDETFRAAFIRNPGAALTHVIECGYELTPLEVSALAATNPRLWTALAQQVDARLQKASLSPL